MRIITSCLKRWPAMALWFMIMLFMTAPLLILAIQRPDLLQQPGTIISHYHGICTFFRWFFLAVLFLIWPKWVRFYARKKHWSKEKTAEWVARRFQLLLWLIVFEWVVNEQWLLVLWQWWEKS
jgi:hypothetical protein